MTPNPILRVLSILGSHRVRYLLMGGQACVLYGAAEFSRDTDIAVLAEPDNLDRLSLSHAHCEDEAGLTEALRIEEKKVREADRIYWIPLKAELEELRRKSV